MKRSYSVGEKLEIELEGSWYTAVVTEAEPGKMIVKIEDELAGDANGMYLRLQKDSLTKGNLRQR